MQIFEFQFNPKKKDRRVETLSYEPESGDRSLYLIGEMRGIVPGNEKLLSKIMKMIRDEYESRSSESFEDAFKGSLIKVNEYLSLEIAKDNVSWLGNLHLAALSVSGKRVDIAKIGKVSTFLMDYEKMNELDGKMGDRPSNDDFRPKTFGTVISGKLGKGERIVVVTEEPMVILKKSGILKRISELPFLDKKIVEDLIDSRKKEISKISGSFFLLDTKVSPKKKKPFLSENEVEFSLKEIATPIKSFTRKLTNRGKKKKGKDPALKLPKIDMREEYRKGLILVFLMAILLLSGFLVFRNNEKKNIEDLSTKVEEMNEVVSNADRLISSNNDREAFSVLITLYKDLSETDHPMFDDLKDKTETRLKKLSKMERIDDPTPMISFDIKDFVPRRIIVNGGSIYLYSSFSDRIAEIDISSMEKTYHKVPAKADSATELDDMVIFFSKPDTVFGIRNGEVIEFEPIKLPYPEAELTDLTSFAGNLYLRDHRTGDILKYGSVDGEPEGWLDPKKEKPTDIRSMSVDGSIWLLNFENRISRYHSGNHEEDISIEIFPFIKSLSGISTSALNPHIFLLEPTEDRFIVVDKRGAPIRQVSSDSFDNLIDFWVSDDGSEIFLLNDLSVYRITI